jgi:RNA polymerase sigma-70 factor, ECF subfamily
MGSNPLPNRDRGMPRDNTTPEAALDSRIDERRLFQEAQAGDLEAFSAAALQLSPRLVRQALLLCGEMEQALDLAQESLVRGWRNLHQYRAQAAPFTWLCGILLHVHKDWLRKRMRRPIELFDPTAPPAWLATTVAADPLEPDASLCNQERDVILRHALERLSQKHREVVFLRFYVDESLASIAAALGCSVGTVKSRLFHGLEKLAGMRELHGLINDRNRS